MRYLKTIIASLKYHSTLRDDYTFMQSPKSNVAMIVFIIYSLI